MKKLDQLLIRTFIPPFILALGVVMFIFTMQSMWKYIDDIIGKGASLGLIVEFVFYLSLGLLPMALPAAVLLASLFMLGNLAERYELTAMKSAGLSFQRIVRPLIFTTLLIAAFSFICSNYIVPVANLKFHARLYDFKNQKLAFSLGEGIFNDDFQNFSIRVGQNDDATGEIKDVMLYDHSVQNYSKTRIILAKKGRTDTQTDDRYMIMTLEDGMQYQEMEEKKSVKYNDPKHYPYLRIHFDTLEKYMNLREFEMNHIDEKLFKDNGKMLSLSQLYYDIDTMYQTVALRENAIFNVPNAYLYFVKKSDSTRYYVPMVALDSISKAKQKQLTPKKKIKKTSIKPFNPPNKKGILAPAKKPAPPQKNITSSTKQDKHDDAMLNGTPTNFTDIFSKRHRSLVVPRAESSIKSAIGKINNSNDKIERLRKRIFKYSYQMHLKFSLAAACLIFLLIGAPLGAIIRKGGFGYPILIGVVLFVLFVTLVTVFEKLGDKGNFPYAFMSAWIPILIFFIPCFFLTRSAMRDAQPITAAAVKSFFKRFSFKQVPKKKA